MKIRGLFYLTWILLVWLLPAADTLAQEDFVEAIEVNLVDVEVWVADSEGRPVSGLKPGEFRVTHDGEPVSLSHFAEVRGGKSIELLGAEQEAVAEVDHDAPPGNLIVYFDQLHLHPRNYKPLIDSLLRFIESGAVEPERILVLRQDQQLYIEAAFGSRREDLESVLRTLAESDSRSVGVDHSDSQALEEIRLAWEQAESQVGSRIAGLSAVPTTAGPPGSDPTGGVSPQDGFGGGSSSGVGPDACDLFLDRVEPIAESWSRMKTQRIALTLGHLSQTGVFLAALPGVKTFLYLSDGLEAQPGAAFSSYIGSLCPAGSGTTMMTVLLEEVSRSMARLTAHLNSNRITVYSLQASGLAASAAGSAATAGSSVGGGKSRASNSYESAQRHSERDGLSFLAKETGGRSVFNQNNFDAGLESLGRDMGSYYSLAYEPPVSQRGREHEIEVELAGFDYEIRYRRGFLDKDKKQWFAERLEGALNLGLVDNALGAGLGAGKMQAQEDGSHVLALHVFVPVSSITFLADEKGESAVLSMQVLARNLSSQKIETVDRRFRARRQPGATDERLGFAVELRLEAGSNAVAVGVQDEVSQQASFITTTVEVPQGD